MTEPRPTDSRLAGPVRVVGTGLLGTSIGLGLTQRGIAVQLADASPANLALAADYGAGAPASADDPEPQLVVVATPPDAVVATVLAELAAHPSSLVTDVASVKAAPLAGVRAGGGDLTRYLGSHPMAGRERGGPTRARADLFLGRPWVLAGHGGMTYQQGAPVEALALDLGAIPVELDAAAHDAAVALVSHVPQLVSSLMAARLVDASDDATALAGGAPR